LIFFLSGLDFDVLASTSREIRRIRDCYLKKTPHPTNYELLPQKGTQSDQLGIVASKEHTIRPIMNLG